MFDVTPDDIALLDDATLRELVARLAAAELVMYGLSPLAVTAGGHQDAPDGGLDVRIELAPNAEPGPNVPRANVGYQVKKPDMGRQAIVHEMRPKGGLRSVIADLAARGGAYIIVSATGSTADGPLQHRRQAMQEALVDCPDADRLLVDFYDRTRMATWVREHPGLVLWLREKVGRTLAGWQAYGNWSNPKQAPDAAYLLDKRARVCFDGPTEPGLPVLAAIERLRALVAQPGTSVRLVGLSGAGKTRLVQALFDARIGREALPVAAAVYTDLHETQTVPQPAVLARELLVLGKRTILVVDNCSALMHKQLTAVCQAAGTTINLVTIEYDVRSDTPEDTEVVVLEMSSDELVLSVLAQRYPALSRENAGIIAHVSGGNTRVALAIASTVRKGDRLAGLQDDVIFERLFHQRHVPDDALLRAAQVCALVYSFDGENNDHDGGELQVLARLAGQDVATFYRCVQVLRERDLMQSRSNWRAVLPQALANRLAGQSLRLIMPEQLRLGILSGSNPRLIRSFAHRLSYLHDQPAAVQWSEELLRPGGLVGQRIDCTPEELLSLLHLAPVVPELVLERVEQGAARDPVSWLDHAGRYVDLLRLLAWDASLFERCVALLVTVVRANRHEVDVEAPTQALVGMCQPYRSGTHASVDARFKLIARWLADPDEPIKELGRQALTQALSSTYKGGRSFSLGARPRDDGYRPVDDVGLSQWYGQGLDLVLQLYAQGGGHAEFARSLVAMQLLPLWRFPLLRDRLEATLRQLGAARFWRAGWVAVRRAMLERGYDAEGRARLERLEQQLAPSDLAGRVLGAVLTMHGSPWHELEAESAEEFVERVEQALHPLAREAVDDLVTLRDLAPILLTRGGHMEGFGAGLAKIESARQAVWDVLTPALETVMESVLLSDHPMRCNPLLVSGFLRQVASKDRALAERFLDQCATRAHLAPALPALQAAIGFDRTALERLLAADAAGFIPLTEFDWLRYASVATCDIQIAALGILARIATSAAGAIVAIDALMAWIARQHEAPQEVSAALVFTSQQVVAHFSFSSHAAEHAHGLLRIAQYALQGPASAGLAAALALKMASAVQRAYNLPLDFEELIALLLEREPEAVLEALCQGEERLLAGAYGVFGQSDRHGVYPLAKLEPRRLAAWCSFDPDSRTKFALKLVPVVETSPRSGRAKLTQQVLALVVQAPNQRAMLPVIVERLEHQLHRNSSSAMALHIVDTLAVLLTLWGSEHHAAVHEAMDGLQTRAEEIDRMNTTSNGAGSERFEP
ncbi:hypothetical protein [Duganella vulcania]|uniref:Uncharacterized protein n=1 Tax=Duganella vulcania TaxID=2692166 RepID=A0A845GEU4_9BURK|nr:hypothetical protein [Duganella vulcania]MYM92431.1 hypothetical protein [Duganella vulcania]